MARSGAFTNWTTLSSTTTQTPEVTEAVNIVLSDAFSNETFNYATKALTYRSTSYTSRLKSIGPIVSQLGNGQSRVTIRLHNGDLGFRDEVTGSYVTSGGKTEFAGQPDKFVGAFVTIRRILTGTVSGNTVSTDLIYLFGKVTGATYSETHFDLDVVTSINLAPSLTDRKVNTKCPWVFKGTECGYSGGLTTCNKLYTDSGGCSGRSNQHRFGGFPARDSAAAIGKVTGLGSAATYQLIQAGSTYQEQRMITAFDDSFGVTDDSGNDRTVVSAITPDWINVQSTTYKAAGVDTTTTGSITSGTASLTVASASSWKVGQGIRIAGAGAAGAALTTTISAISGTTFTLATNASTTVSSASVVHDDTTALQTAINDGITNARPIYIPKGTYRVTGLSVPGGATIIGDGPQLTVIKSVTNAVILNCPRATNDAGPYAYQGARIERIGVLGSVTAGSSQIGIKCDDPVYALGHYLDDVRISDCGSHGLYIGNSFSSHFEKIYSTNSEGFNFKIYSPNMPCVTLHQCNTGTVRSASPVGFMIVSGSIRLESCNGIYGGAGTDWWGVVGGKANLYGETVNSTAYVQFVNCNFESNTVGGIRFLNNSRGDFDGCAWVGDASGSGSYKALLYDVDLVDRVSTTGSITSGTNSLTVASANSWTAGQGIKIAGAGAAGANLSTTISSIAGNVFTLAVNASTTVSGAVVTHTDDLFYPWEGPKGFIADNCLFTQSPITYYANSQPIHISAFPTTGNAYPPLQTLGQGPKMSGGTGFIASFYNDSASTTRPLIRADANAVKQVITASTTFAVPGVRYIECNHTGAITVTLPWAASYSNIGQPVVVKDISSAGAGTNNITINSGGGGTVNGSSYVISQNKGAVTLVPDGSNDWRVVGEFRSASVVPLIFPDGSTSSLAIQRSGDSDTGLFIDANGFYFSKDGTEYARIVGNDNRFKGVVRIESSGLGQSYLTVDNEDLWIQFNSTLRWVMEKNGRLYPAGQNTQDLGYSGGGELRTGYFGTSLDLGRSSNTTGTLVLRNATNSNTTTVQAGAAGSNLTFTLPTSAGTNGQALTTNGSGTTSWSTISASPGGSTTQVQFNDAGSFGGDAGLTYDKTTDALTVAGPTQMSELRLKETGGGSDYVGFKAPASVTTNKIWTLPSVDGSSGQVLGTSGSAVLQWQSAREILTANRTYWVGFLPGDAGTGVVAFSNGSATLTCAGHGLQANDPVVFSTNGTLPTNFTAGTTYYVRSTNLGTTFEVSATAGTGSTNTNTAITAGSAGSGTHFVRTGNDNNIGYGTNGRSVALLTVQKAIDLIGAIDTSIYKTTIKCARGQYANAFWVQSLKTINRLDIIGDDRYLAGLTYFHGADIGHNAPAVMNNLAGNGNATISWSTGGTEITITGATANPNISADGWGANDKIVLFVPGATGAGTFYEYTVSSTAGAVTATKITITGATLPTAPSPMTAGVCVTLVPNVKLQSSSNGGRTVGGEINVTNTTSVLIKGWHLRVGSNFADVVYSKDNSFVSCGWNLIDYRGGTQNYTNGFSANSAKLNSLALDALGHMPNSVMGGLAYNSYALIAQSNSEILLRSIKFINVLVGIAAFDRSYVDAVWNQMVSVDTGFDVQRYSYVYGILGQVLNSTRIQSAASPTPSSTNNSQIQR